MSTQCQHQIEALLRKLNLPLVGKSCREKGLVSRTIIEEVIVPVAARSHHL